MILFQLSVSLVEQYSVCKFEGFINSIDCIIFDNLFLNIRDFQNLFKNINGPSKFVAHCRKCENQSNELDKEFSKFVQYESNERKQFYYCGLFLGKLFPVFRGFAHSFKYKNQKLNLHAARKGMSIFFIFDRTNLIDASLL